MTLHDLFKLLILMIATSGTNRIHYMKYISEYIPKLQIHQQILGNKPSASILQENGPQPQAKSW